MLSTINKYYDLKEKDEQTSKRMSLLAEETKKTNEYFLFKKIVETEVNRTLDYACNFPLTSENSHALLHKIAGMRSVLKELDNIIINDDLLTEQLKEEEKEDNDFILNDDVTDNALI